MEELKDARREKRKPRPMPPFQFTFTCLDPDLLYNMALRCLRGKVLRRYEVLQFTEGTAAHPRTGSYHRWDAHPVERMCIMRLDWEALQMRLQLARMHVEAARKIRTNHNVAWQLDLKNRMVECYSWSGV